MSYTPVSSRLALMDVKVDDTEFTGVDDRLRHIIDETANRMGVNVLIRSGKEKRKNNRGYHPAGKAIDIYLLDKDGNPIPHGAGGNNSNSRRGAAAGFGAYQQFAHATKAVQEELYPRAKLRWGGYFSGPPTKYGSLDTMHWDIDAEEGMAGGSWDTGLYPQQRQIWVNNGYDIVDNVANFAPDRPAAFTPGERRNLIGTAPTPTRNPNTATTMLASADPVGVLGDSLVSRVSNPQFLQGEPQSGQDTRFGPNSASMNPYRPPNPAGSNNIGPAEPETPGPLNLAPTPQMTQTPQTPQSAVSTTTQMVQQPVPTPTQNPNPALKSMSQHFPNRHREKMGLDSTTSRLSPYEMAYSMAVGGKPVPPSEGMNNTTPLNQSEGLGAQVNNLGNRMAEGIGGGMQRIVNSFNQQPNPRADATPDTPNSTGGGNLLKMLDKGGGRGAGDPMTDEDALQNDMQALNALLAQNGGEQNSAYNWGLLNNLIGESNPIRQKYNLGGGLQAMGNSLSAAYGGSTASPIGSGQSKQREAELLEKRRRANMAILQKRIEAAQERLDRQRLADSLTGPYEQAMGSGVQTTPQQPAPQQPAPQQPAPQPLGATAQPSAVEGTPASQAPAPSPQEPQTNTFADMIDVDRPLPYSPDQIRALIQNGGNSYSGLVQDMITTNNEVMEGNRKAAMLRQLAAEGRLDDPTAYIGILDADDIAEMRQQNKSYALDERNVRARETEVALAIAEAETAMQQGKSQSDAYKDAIKSLEYLTDDPTKLDALRRAQQADNVSKDTFEAMRGIVIPPEASSTYTDATLLAGDERAAQAAQGVPLAQRRIDADARLRQSSRVIPSAEDKLNDEVTSRRLNAQDEVLKRVTGLSVPRGLEDALDEIIRLGEKSPKLGGPFESAVVRPLQNFLQDFGMLSPEDTASLSDFNSMLGLVSFVAPRLRVEGSGSTSDYEALRNAIAIGDFENNEAGAARRMALLIRNQLKDARRYGRYIEKYGIEDNRVLGVNELADRYRQDTENNDWKKTGQDFFIIDPSATDITDVDEATANLFDYINSQGSRLDPKKLTIFNGGKTEALSLQERTALVEAAKIYDEVYGQAERN